MIRVSPAALLSLLGGLCQPGCALSPSEDFKGLEDADGDGHNLAEDCGPEDRGVHPGALEVEYDGLDNDCAPSTRDSDLDGDGQSTPLNCKDSNASMYEGADEALYGCDGVDNDCSGEPDNGAGLDHYRDLDGDGFGDLRISANGVDIPSGSERAANLLLTPSY